MSAPQPSQQTWDPGLYDQRHGFVWQHGESLVELLQPQPGERILDLGCGTGHLTAAIAQRGATVIGLDHSTEMLEQARAAYPTLEFVQGDARNFSFSEPFDAVFSNAVLHWILEPRQVIERVRSALKPGGRFVAEFGGRGNVSAIVDSLRQAARRAGISLNEPLWYFPSIGEYASLLEAAGMEVRFASLFDRPIALTENDGLRAWVRQFGRAILDTIPLPRQEEFLGAVEECARPLLFREGVWHADYRRIRVVAFASS